jgi:myo-inositol-1-phosphate synthase
VPWLTDRKWAHIRLEGTAFGGVPLKNCTGGDFMK